MVDVDECAAAACVFPTSDLVQHVRQRSQTGLQQTSIAAALLLLTPASVEPKEKLVKTPDRRKIRLLALQSGTLALPRANVFSFRLAPAKNVSLEFIVFEVQRIALCCWNSIAFSVPSKVLPWRPFVGVSRALCTRTVWPGTLPGFASWRSCAGLR